MTNDTPRRPRRSLAEQEADLKAKLAALDAKRMVATRKKLQKLSEDAELIDLAGVPADVAHALSIAIPLIDRWLSSAKPGEGK